MIHALLVMLGGIVVGNVLWYFILWAFLKINGDI